MEYMLEKEWEVLYVDNLVTGSEANIARLRTNPKFMFELKDVSEHIQADGLVDAVLYFASPADPPD